MQSQTNIRPLLFADRLSRAQGRMARRYSATAKLTRDELDVLEATAKEDGRALGEWAREVLLATARGQTVTPLFTELIATRRFLNTTMRRVACGKPMTDAEFEKELQDLRATKHQAATEMMQQYAAKEERR